MSALRKIGSAFLPLSAIAALVMGGIALTASPAEAAIIGPECGPTYLWLCTKPNGRQVLFGGTICEKIRFEKKTGSTCVPAPF